MRLASAPCRCDVPHLASPRLTMYALATTPTIHRARGASKLSATAAAITVAGMTTTAVETRPLPALTLGRLGHDLCLSRKGMAESEQLTNEEEERRYRQIEDWFARKEKLFWTAEVSGGTWDAFVASGHMMDKSSRAVGPCVRGAATRLDAAQKAQDLHRKLL